MLRTALAPAIAGYSEDPAIIEVMLNPMGDWGSTDRRVGLRILFIAPMLERYMAADRSFGKARRALQRPTGE